MALHKVIFLSAAGFVSALVFSHLLAGSAPPKATTQSIEAPVHERYQMRLSATSGGAPLSVTFTVAGTGVYFGGVWLETGDGHMVVVCPPGRRCGEVTIKHIYLAAGNFRARLVGKTEGAAENLNEVQLSVSGG